jgi:hypothetical protein
MKKQTTRGILKMRAYTLASAGLLLLASSLVHAQQPPAAPQVTASANLKELVFDWDPVPGAYTYWLLEKPYDPSRRTYFTPIQDRIPASRTRAALPVAVHQFNWWENRYIIAACNTAGCTRSAEISPFDLMLDAIGYFKASNADAGDRFGRGIALSADGTTLAVSAPGEDSAATGVNGNQADNSSADSGAVYVFRRTGRQWAQEAYLKAGVNQPGQGLGAPIDPLATKTMAISADGAWLAVGAPAQGTSPANAGAVYLFRRGSSGWSLASTLQAASPTANDQFGFSVDMSQDGRTLKVSSLRPLNGAGNPVGRTHIYVRPADSWQHSATLAPYHSGDECPTVRMASNGETLIAACRSSSAQRAVTLRRIGTAWVHVAELPLRGFKVGQPMAVDHHATRLWIWEGNFLFPGNDQMGRYHWTNGEWVLNATQLGPDDPSWPAAVEFDTVADNAAFSDVFAAFQGSGMVRQTVSGGYGGGAYLYRFIPESLPAHQPRPSAKAPNPDPGDSFGAAMAYSGNGRIFAVGAPDEDSAARGIDGDRADNSAEDSGAVYLY